MTNRGRREAGTPVPGSDETEPATTETGRTRVVLFSVAAGIEGHGRRYLSELARHLCADGRFEVVVAAPDVAGLDRELRDWGATFSPLQQDATALSSERFRRYGPLAGLMRGLARFRLGRAANRAFVRDTVAPHAHREPTVVHFLDYEYLTLASALRSLERHASISAVVTVHASDFAQRRLSVASVYKNLTRLVLRRRFRGVCAAICHGEWIADRLADQLSLHGRTRTIYIASEGDDGRIDKKTARQSLGIPRDAQVLLWFGMIRRNKRLDFALSVLQQLPDDVSMLIAGKPAEIGEGEIRSWIRDLGLEDRVYTHFEYIAEDDLPTYFSAADLLIATHGRSFTSGSGCVSDARTYRLPVVASDVGQIAEYVRRFGVGAVGPPEDPKAFAHEVAKMLHDPSAQGAVVEAVERAARDLSWREFARRHAEVYLECAPGGGPSTSTS